MPNTIDASGLTIKTLSEIVADLTTGMQNIFGADINVDSNSPDGQLINVFAQAAIDNLEVLVDAYNVLNPESAYGAALDNVAAFNGVVRIGATYTTAPVAITTDRAVTLTGRDALLANPSAIVYAVKDNTGNVFELVTTKVFAAAGTDTLTFQAQTPGAVEVVPNTITEQNTAILGVTGVNNPSVVAVIRGQDEETDAALKIRRAKMYKLASSGPADALEAALLATAGIEDAYVVENATAGTVDSIPAHSIQVVVKRTTASGADVGAAIYAKKAFGCGTYGSAFTPSIVSASGQNYFFKYSDAVAEQLFAKFTIVPTVTGQVFDAAALADSLAAALVYRLGQQASIGDLIEAMRTIDPRAILTAVGVSLDGITYTDVIPPTLNVNYFSLAAADIDITV